MSSEVPKVQLRSYPDDILNTTAAPIPLEELEDPAYLAHICDLMHEGEKLMRSLRGVGISANQCGDLRRWIIVGDLLCINPTWRAAKESSMVAKKEACLSWDWGKVDEGAKRLWRKRRHSVIWVNYIDTNGRMVAARLRGKKAQCYQHECDHLDGKNIWQEQPN